MVSIYPQDLNLRHHRRLAFQTGILLERAHVDIFEVGVVLSLVVNPKVLKSTSWSACSLGICVPPFNSSSTLCI
jgi:hypothetical protein